MIKMSTVTKSSIMSKAISLTLLCSFIFTNAFAIQTFAQRTNKAIVTPSALVKYTIDLTQLARENKLRVNDSYQTETNRLMKSLSGGDLRQTVVLDEANKNQELVIEQLAIRASQELPAKRILKLEVGKIYANAKSDLEVAEITNKVFGELVQENDAVLFVDELTNFIGTSNAGASLNNLLLQGKIRIIGGSSKAAYKENIEPIAEVDALFEKITVGDKANFSEETTAANEKYDGYRGDNVSPDLREMMAKDPSGEKRVDVIIQAKDAESADLRAMMREGKARLSDRIGETDNLVVNIPLSSVARLSESGLINHISPNRPVQMFGHVENTTGATNIRSANGSTTTLDGTGIGIAVLDSGMYVDHSTFKANGTSRVVYSQSFVPGESAVADGYGHGTHVASLAAGGSNRDNGAYRGVAPNAKIINLKVLNNQGFGNTAWLLNALEWIKTNHAT
jgi:hypothetical protein